MAAQKIIYQEQLKKQEELDVRTLYILRTGEMQPERDHSLTGENTFTGSYNNGNWRDAKTGAISVL